MSNANTAFELLTDDREASHKEQSAVEVHDRGGVVSENWKIDRFGSSDRNKRRTEQSCNSSSAVAV
jgi:hypothetical protein